MAAITAWAMYAQEPDLSAEGIAGLMVGATVGGVVWGALATWLVRRFIRPKS